jgi:hypothetical protein
MKIGSYYISFMILLVCMFMLIIAGCSKEYSYEGGEITELPTDSIPGTDTIIDDTIKFPVCDACKEMAEPILSTWSFKYGTSFLCGNITSAILSPDRTAFTFFGPSACSLDTGLVMTVYLNKQLDRDISNVFAVKALFQYYDNATGPNIFLSDQVNKIDLMITSYDDETGIAKGIFSGISGTYQNGTATIKEGNFQIQFQ